MDAKMKKVIQIIIGLYVGGIISLWIGLAYGEELGSSLSRPIGASSWTVSNGLVNACTYVPIVIGISLMITAIIFCMIVFKEWVKNFMN